MNPYPSMQWLSLISLCAAALSSPAVYAQVDADAGEQATSSWGLGAGVMMTKMPYREFDNKVEAIPLVTYENQWVRVFGPNLAVKLPSVGPVSFNFNARYALEDGYKASDSSFLTGMDKRKAGAWLGASASWHGKITTWSAGWMGNATGESKGQQFRLAIEKNFQFGKFGLAPRIAATWMDSKYVDYYYGVKSSEATVGRPQYSGTSTVNTEFALHGTYALAANQFLSLDLGVTRLGSAIKDSPLVDRSTMPAARLFYLYRF
jgi:outer membrane scaffolding protein for murein synthesis (MipA/OmpV family)